MSVQQIIDAFINTWGVPGLLVVALAFIYYKRDQRYIDVQDARILEERAHKDETIARNDKVLEVLNANTLALNALTKVIDATLLRGMK